MESKACTPRLFHCYHCDQEVSKRTFFQHKRLYYNRSKKTEADEDRATSTTPFDIGLPVEDSDQDSPFDFNATQYSPIGLEAGKPKYVHSCCC